MKTSHLQRRRIEYLFYYIRKEQNFYSPISLTDMIQYPNFLLYDKNCMKQVVVETVNDQYSKPPKQLSLYKIPSLVFFLINNYKTN